MTELTAHHRGNLSFEMSPRKTAQHFVPSQGIGLDKIIFSARWITTNSRITWK